MTDETQAKADAATVDATQAAPEPQKRADPSPEPAAQNGGEMLEWPTVHIPLRQPLNNGRGETVSEIVLAEPDIEALEVLDDLDLKPDDTLRIRHIRKIAAAMAGWSEQAMGKVKAQEFSKISEAIVPFIGAVVTAKDQSSSSSSSGEDGGATA